MATNRKLWPMDGHTAGKHLVLRAYLDAWFGILSNRFNRLLFVDGFSGPGEYLSGEDGSPIIALKSVIEHSHSKVLNTHIRYIFIELDVDRLEHLRNRVEVELPNIPRNIHLEYICSSFENAVKSNIIPALEAQVGAPAFVMIDPFGIDYTPMKALVTLMSYPRVELYISLMYEFINRFKRQEEFREPLNRLFGCDEWQACATLDDKTKRKHALYKLYKGNLKKYCAKQVIHFDLYHGNRLKYGIFFASQSTVGSRKIKEAIWRVVPNGEFAFRSENNPQLNINLDAPSFQSLQNYLIEFIRGKGFVAIEEILSFIDSDATEYHRGHVKTYGLKAIEQSGIFTLTVQREEAKPRRSLTYPADCSIKIE